MILTTSPGAGWSNACIPVVVDYSAAGCGAGKTFWVMNFIAIRPGKFLVALDRIDAFEARRSMLLDAFHRVGKVSASDRELRVATISWDTPRVPSST
jgi:hypothetical protein